MLEYHWVQKYLIIFILLVINFILSFTSIIYTSKWYVYLSILALSPSISTINTFLILAANFRKSIFKQTPTLELTQNQNNLKILEFEYHRLVYLLPCYNENEDELTGTINSILNQSYDISLTSIGIKKNVESEFKKPLSIPIDDKKIEHQDYAIFEKSRILIIVCDGKIEVKNKKAKQTETTASILYKIFKDDILETNYFKEGYKTWDDWQNIELHYGIYKQLLPFIILIKDVNKGKRDSITLIRRLLYHYNILCNIQQNKDSSNDSSKESNSDSSRDSSNNSSLDRQEINLLDFKKADVDQIDLRFLDIYTYFCPNLFFKMKDYLDDICKTEFFDKNKKIEFIMGIDADTILEQNCTIHLLKTYYENEKLISNNIPEISLEGESINKYEEKHKKHKTLVGVVGMVDINNITLMNPFIFNQYYEYLHAQLLKRRCQSIITNKVNCLSGCNQLIRICEETCGNKILDDFNKKPKPDENIFRQILSYASEDRNHICLMFKHYPWVRTVQSINAISYTNVPNNLMTLLRQRKRWCLGAFSNDILIIANKNHPYWERLNAVINGFVFMLCPFIMVATIEFILSIIHHPTFLMLALSSIMIVPILYGLCIPFLIYKPMNKFQKVNYYLGMLSFYSWGIVLNLVIFLFSILNLDDFQWNNKRIQNNISNTNNPPQINKISRIFQWCKNTLQKCKNYVKKCTRHTEKIELTEIDTFVYGLQNNKNPDSYHIDEFDSFV